jgi:hypothetical protein
MIAKNPKVESRKSKVQSLMTLVSLQTLDLGLFLTLRLLPHRDRTHPDAVLAWAEDIRRVNADRGTPV